MRQVKLKDNDTNVNVQLPASRGEGQQRLDRWDPNLKAYPFTINLAYFLEERCQ
jgi:hypothetical protein